MAKIYKQFNPILEQFAASIPAFKSLMELQEECKKAVEIQDIHQQKHIKPISIKKGY